MLEQTTSYTNPFGTNSAVEDVFYCPKCGGVGKVHETGSEFVKTCDLCGGSGFVSRERIALLNKRIVI